MNDRIAWIDIAKILGLILIVFAHFDQGWRKECLYWFHVPLFFVLSGMLHRQRRNIFSFVASKFKHLMVPYLAFISVCILFTQAGLGDSIPVQNILLGGAYLRDTPVMKWWFVPCLFFTQLAAAFLLRIKNRRFIVYILIGSFFTAIMIQYRCTVFMWGAPFNLLSLPLALDIVFMSIVFYMVGYAFRVTGLASGTPSMFRTIAMLGTFMAFAYLDYRGIIRIPVYDMIARRYGFPVLNIIVPLLGFFIIRDISLYMSRQPFLNKMLVGLGRAALPIIFLHLILTAGAIQAINKLTGTGLDNILLKLLLGLVLPYAVYRILMCFDVGRKLFLGVWSDTR